MSFWWKKYRLLIILGLGLLIRLFFVPQPGFSADIAYWKWWGMDAFRDGVVHTITYTGYNYPSFYLYVLAATNGIYSLFSPLDTDVFWNENNVLFLFLIKLPYILADIGAGYLIFNIIKKTVSEKWAIMAASFYIFNPVVIFNSSFWGQTDNLAAFLVLAVLWLLFKGKYTLGIILATIALFSKTQVAIFLPFIFGLIAIRKGLAALFRSFLVMGVTIFVINLPYVLNNNMDKVLDLILNAASWFPYASLNAYNFWWFSVPDMNFRSSSDAQLLFNSVTYKTTGILAFFLWWGLAFLVFINNFKTKLVDLGKAKDEIWGHLNFGFWASIAIVPFAFFMLPTEMHERYIFPFFLFMTLALPHMGKKCSRIIQNSPARNVFAQNIANGKLHVKNQKLNKYLFYIFSILITISIFLNLHIVLVTNYPRNGFNFLSGSFLISLGFTRFLAIVNILLFGYFSFIVFKLLPKKIVGVVGLGAVMAYFVLIVGGKLNYQKINVYIDKLRPVYATQDYGKLSKNKTVANRILSSAYYFFNRGLGTHANSQVVYNLGGQFRVFESEVGIDTEAIEPATVVFKVVGDGKILYKSPVMNKWDKPEHIKVNVAGVNQLVLVVEDGGDGINNDHAGWYNAKLRK